MLPLHFADILISVRDSLLSIDIHQGTSVGISVALKGTRFAVAKLDDRCQVTFVGLKGCFNCRGGTILSVKSSSTPSSLLTSTTIDCGGVSTQFTSQPIESQHDVHLSFETSSVNMNCSVTCGSAKSGLVIKGRLDFVGLPDASPNERTWVTMLTSYGGLSWDVLFSLFDFSHSYFTILIDIIVIMGL